LKGFGHSVLSLAVHKETEPVEFAVEQATFMLFLGESVCPKILSVNEQSYVMEYLRPTPLFIDSLVKQEQKLAKLVWSRDLDDVPYAKVVDDESWHEELEKTIGIKVPEWAWRNDDPCLIHGDPTLDNTYGKKGGGIRIADPIPPHRLIRPSIKAVDHGKILQSLLGWEVVLRGATRLKYEMPSFMKHNSSAMRAIFWCMVALKRIALRNSKGSAGRWAGDIAKELEECIR
jgi:hypothetical protein